MKTRGGKKDYPKDELMKLKNRTEHFGRGWYRRGSVGE